MGSDEISDVNAGAGEGVGGMMNGTGLISGSIAKSEAGGGGRSGEVEPHINNELVEIGGGGFGR